MNLSDKIKIVAEWLENEENELLKETSDKDVVIVAEAFVEAAHALRKVASEITPVSNEDTMEFSPETIQEIAAVAEAYDSSGDEELQKQASVLDELLLTIAAPRDFIANYRAIEDMRTEELKKKYKDLREETDLLTDKAATLEALKKSEVFQERHPDMSLSSSRGCPEHGSPMFRVGGTAEGSIWQCSLDHKVFNYEEGFTLADGTKVSPRSISNQGVGIEQNTHQIFDDRTQRLTSR
jgi:hypothetical protein